ncbi:uncharacterized protein Tco025E_02232 [Trypanosoma conorhini]|uniref:Uncharacterized protein n=1 Tax=Trypanosoma conorhini TaxID=83891 RepID=A0A3S5IUD7_9TRYP|nr:uncharacterized protein Tco025E_02232 [Trypanosoma conorhini]RNF25349.1 hypothetical protein Tco025E_02232 [Trypanosoma conorhini]
MLPASLDDAHRDECADDKSLTRPPPALLEEAQRLHLELSSSRVAFTLSNSLVQFLSPLQLQGFASRLIESCGVHHMDELAARVTCEDDVEELLGSHASLQQRRELWKGVCKWKRTAGKRAREPTKKSDKKKALTGGNSRDAEVVPGRVQGSTTGRLLDLDKCTPSQFMRQFAFCGHQDAEIDAVTRPSTEVCGKSAVESVTGEADGGSATAALMASLEASPCSFSWASSVSPLGGTPFRAEKRYRREELPISALSVGPGMTVAGENEFEEGGGGCEDDARQQNLLPSAVPLETEGEAVDVRQPIEECSAEYEVMRKAMCVALSNAVATYNARLGALQERLRTVLAAAAGKRRRDPCDSGVFVALEKAVRLEREPPLRLEMHPAGPQQAGSVSFPSHVPQQCPERAQSAKNECDGLSASGGGNPELCEVAARLEPSGIQLHPTLMLNATVVSSPSGNVGEDALPSLSDMTSPSRGSYRRTEGLTLEEPARRCTATLHVPPRAMSGLATNDTSQGVPAAFSLDEESTVPLTANLGQHVSIADVAAVCNESSGSEEELLPRPSAVRASPPLLGGATADVTRREPLETRGTILLDDFGLQAIPNEVTHSSLSRAAPPASAGELSMGDGNLPSTAAETQVIDVDALSSLESGTNEGCLPHRRQEDIDAIPVDDCSDQLSAHSSPMALQGCSSQEEHIWMCSQLPRERQRAVSRSASLSPPQASGNAFMDSLSMSVGNCARGLDWTTQTSIAADARDLPPKPRPDGDRAGSMNSDEHQLGGKATVSVTSERAFSPPRSLAPAGLPPMPSRSLMNTTLPDAPESLNDTVEELTTEGVMSMSYEMLRQWCLRLGLRLLCDETYATDAGEKESCDATRMEISEQEDSRGFTFTQGENSNGWWLDDGGADINEGELDALDGDRLSRSPQRQHPSWEGSGTTTPLPLTPGIDTGEAEWRDLQRAALIEQMREALRLFITRRQFMFEVAPFFFHRLPRFSGGDSYKPVRAADLVRKQLALTRQELEEQRRLAKMMEAEEVACCVITGLAAEAAESIERQAVLPAKGQEVATGQGVDPASASVRSRSPQRTCNAAYPGMIPVYEQLLLMEPIDVQVATSVVQADFPHVSRHRVEALLEESGIPLDMSRRVCNSQSDGGGELNATQRSASSCSPPPGSPIGLTQTGPIASAQESKRRFFAQRGWAQRRRNR